ncbi:MAG: hypothetical protein D6B27_06470 [Gammaproteobacteria bacterium]|nr:MAG: hypothetical protein D6B27_06470 [Gammaproteobacteria bacterium]
MISINCAFADSVSVNPEYLGKEYIAGELLIRYKAGSLDSRQARTVNSTKDTWLKDIGVKSYDHIFKSNSREQRSASSGLKKIERIIKVKVDPDADISELIEQISQNENIEFVELN